MALYALIERAAAGGAAVGDVDERQAGQAEVADERVGGAGGGRAAERVVDLLPRQAGVGQRGAGRVGALLASADRVPAEGVDADADDGDVAHEGTSWGVRTGRNANVAASSPVTAEWNGTITSSISMPIFKSSTATSTSNDSTLASPASST